MNNLVPEFDDCVNVNQISSSSSLNHQSTMGQEDDVVELLWHNGQVVLHKQKPINVKKPSSSSSVGGGGEVAPPPPLHQLQPLDQNLFIQEDEMTSWLHYPLRKDGLCSDILFPSSSGALSAPSAPTSESQTMTQVTASIPPVSSVRRTENAPRPMVRNFMNFSRLRGNFTGGNGRGESAPTISKAIVRESTQVKPSATPAAEVIESGLIRRTDDIDSRGKVTCVSSSAVAGGGAYSFAVPGNSLKGKAVAAECEIPGQSSSVVSKSEIEPVKVLPEKTIIEDRKRKEREAIDETECRSEETKQACGLTSTKRSRAAQVHNLSERKRRDRINERMKALQQLIPRCNKSDKASMLDEAINYMKSLQLQIQMMSMGCGMMMYSGMPHMAMGMNQPPSFMPFPNMLATQRPLGGSVFSGPNHYPLLACVTNQQSDPTSSQPQYSGYIDPYQQLRSLHLTQAPQFQNQATSDTTSNRESNSKESKDQGNHTTG